MINWLDFKSIKRTVTLESVLRHYQVKLRRSGTDQYRGCCPIVTVQVVRAVAGAEKVWVRDGGSCALRQSDSSVRAAAAAYMSARQ